MLIGLALATLWVSPLMTHPLAANAILLAIAAVKGRRIVLDYLDLRSAPAMWRGLVSTWVFLVAAFAWTAAAITHLI